MNRLVTLDGLRDERGFILPAVLVFSIVLLLSAFWIATVTRADVQVVNNIHSEKKAFNTAEAGVNEALARLAMVPTDPATITVNGNTFDPRITPDESTVYWDGYVLFAGSAPATTGAGTSASRKTYTTPTVQANGSSQLLYSATATNSTNPPPLSLSWVPDSAGTGIKMVNGKKLLKISSTGQTGPASQTVNALVTQTNNIGAVFLDPTACSSFDLRANSLTFPYGIQINSSCSSALNAQSAASNLATSVNIVGGYTGASIAPTPVTGAPVMPDPLQSIVDLVRPSGSCQTINQTTNVTTALNPGFYCGITASSGALTFAPGNYYIQGPFNITGSASLSGSGVMFYIAGTSTGVACTSTCVGVGSIHFDMTPNPTLSAPTSGTYAGILFFQDRYSTKPVELWGGYQTGLDGALYAKSARVTTGNGNAGNKVNMHLELVVGSMTFEVPTDFQYSSNSTVRKYTNKGFQVLSWSDF